MLSRAADGTGYGEYGPEHVERLREQVAANLDRPYGFVCLKGSMRRGWWAKLDLFKPGRFFGRVLYLDLDVCVTGALEPIVDFPAAFAAPRDPLYLGYNSSVMVWDANTRPFGKVWIGPPDDWPQTKYGDQRWIYHCMHGVGSFLPPRWCTSYKAGLEYGQWSTEMKVVYFTGQPKPWDVERPYPWEEE